MKIKTEEILEANLDKVKSENRSMKTYPYILINKSKMNELNHFSASEDLVTHLIGRAKNWKNWIIIKNEKIIIDLSHFESSTNTFDLFYTEMKNYFDKI
jgi:hypothetical protein